MLSRRALLATVGALGAVTELAGVRLFAGEPPSRSVVMGACDTHVHVVGDPKKFPMAKDRDYTPPAATASMLLAALKELKFERVVIVTPTIYDNDNSVTLNAIETIGRKQARGVAMVDESKSRATLDALRDGGIAGIRLLLDGPPRFKPAMAAERLSRLIGLAEKRGWHIEISTPPDVIAALSDQLFSCPVPLVLGYFGWVAGGVGQPGFDVIRSLLASGRIYIKFAEPYRLSRYPPDYPDLEPVVRAYVAANPDQLLWGSGWPHVDSSGGRGKISPNLPVTDQHLFQLFEAWVPDPGIRRKILFDNPSRLYRF